MAELNDLKVNGDLEITGTLTTQNTIATGLEGLTATVAELNYMDGVTSNVQTQLNGKSASSHTHSEYAASNHTHSEYAAASHGTHVSYGTSASALGTSSAGSASTVSRSDHVHALPALTSCTGTLTVAKGGTGATTFTSGAVLLGNGTGAVTTRAIQNNTAVSAVTANNNLITGNTLAVWNGRYDSSNSKLAYCNKGAFGDMATKTASNYLAKAGGTMTGAINMGGNSLNSVYAIGMYNGARFNSTGGQSLYIAAGNEDDYRLFLGVADSNWVFSPSKDGYLRCGTASYRWGQVYCKSSTISTSDRNQKKEIQPLTEQHLKFFTMLEPVSYKFIDGTSGRTHIGFVSQDVEEAMAKCGLTDLDFAGFCKDQKYENVTLEDGTTEQKIVEGVYIYSLRYEEFIALVTQATQYALDKIETLEDRMNKFEERLASLENVA